MCAICAHPLTLYHYFYPVDRATDLSVFLLVFTSKIVKFGPKTFHGLVLVTTVDQSNSSEGLHDNITKEKPHPNQVPSEPSVELELKPSYTWTKSGHTECSTTCGTGKESFGWLSY